MSSVIDIQLAGDHELREVNSLGTGANRIVRVVLKNTYSFQFTYLAVPEDLAREVHQKLGEELARLDVESMEGVA